MADPKQSFLLMLYVWLRRARLFPRAADWEVPWNGWAVLIAFCAVLLLPSLIQAALGDSGFFSLRYGPDFPAKGAPDDWKDPTRKQAAHLRGLWTQALALPLLVLLIVVGLKYGTQARLGQMGLTRERLGTNIVLGYLGWLVLAPVAYVGFMLAVLLFAPNPSKHPLMDLGDQAGRVEWIVFGLQAAVFAPVLEELLFRGVLLAWLVQKPRSDRPDRHLILQPPHRSHVVYAVALLVALQSPALSDALQARRWDGIVSHLAPGIFLLALLPFYLILPLSTGVQRVTRLSSPQNVRACFASAVLFAAIHSNVWPSPVPLFLLALGLGWLAMRTRSIVSCIIVHMLFNAVAVVYLMLGGPL